MSNEKIKVITCKIGTDGHYRGIEAVTRALRDAGMEVVYLGAGRRVEEVIKELGIAEVFLPGVPLAHIVDYVSREVEKRRRK